MTIASRNLGQCTVIELGGRLDADSVPELERFSGALIDDGATSVVIDLYGLEYISSAGLRSILIISKRLRSAGGRLGLARAAGPVSEVLSISGFPDMMPVHDTIEETLAEL